MIIFLFLFCISSLSLSADIRFGSDTSNIGIYNNATLDVVSSNFIASQGGIKQKDSGAILGNNIFFDEAIYETNKSEVLITGSYKTDPSGTGTIVLFGSADNPHVFRAESGLEIEQLVVKGSHNRIEGFPSFRNPIILEDSNTTLTIAIKSICNENIELHNSTLILDDNLSFADGYAITGSGTVKLNGRRLAFGSEDLAISSSIYWIGAADVYLNGRVDLSASWTFENKCYLNGDSVVLNLNPNGSLSIRDNSSLRIRQVKISGLGNEPGLGKIYFEDDSDPSSSELRSQRGAFSLTSTYTIDRGHIIVEVARTQIITRDNVIYFVSPGRLTVDDCNLFYKTRTYPDFQNIQPEDYSLPGGPISLINSGDILHYKSFLEQQGTLVEAGGDPPLLGSPTLIDYKYVYIKQNLHFGSESSFLQEIDLAYPLIINFYLDGGGYFMHFARNEEDLLEVSNCSLWLYDIVLKDFKPQHVKLNNGALVFGRSAVGSGDVLIELGNDIAFGDNPSTSYSWTFSGMSSKGIINGKGKAISMEEGNIFVKNGSHLVFKDVTFEKLKQGAIQLEGDAAKLTFNNVKMNLSENITFSVGSFEVDGYLNITSAFENKDVSFIYNTNCPIPSTIKKGSTLHFDQNVTFSYDQLTNNNLINFEDNTSIISLNGATIISSNAGLLLTKGTLVGDYICTFSNQAIIPNQGILFGDGINAANDFNVVLMPEANINIASGILHYNNVNG